MDITLVTKGRAVVKVTRFEFNNILVTCSIGRRTTSATSDTFPHTIKVDSKGNFHATVKAHGGLATYSVRGHFKSPNRATGTLRIKGTVPACSGADSGTVRWSAKHD